MVDEEAMVMHVIIEAMMLDTVDSTVMVEMLALVIGVEAAWGDDGGGYGNRICGCGAGGGGYNGYKEGRHFGVGSYGGVGNYNNPVNCGRQQQSN